MKIDSGRSKLYSALKDLRRVWQETSEVWQDKVRQDFEDQTITPVDRLCEDVIEAMDQLSQVLAQVVHECEGREEVL